MGINVPYVGKYLGMTQTLRDINEHTLVKTHISVYIVGRASVGTQTLFHIREPTLGKNHICVLYVASPFVINRV